VLSISLVALQSLLQRPLVLCWDRAVPASSLLLLLLLLLLQ
jgi:hypothetical protein